MKPPVLDPVCGMSYTNEFSKHTHEGKDYFFCSEDCLETFRQAPGRYQNVGVRGKYTLAFYDTITGNSVLNVPVIFKTKEDTHDAGGHHH
ncbi:MAG: YHS domain-containing protein [Nitrospiraceae bacterium]|nr:MAG: YHS domain-containing protein [Nitrospiraceae bacterium]